MNKITGSIPKDVYPNQISDKNGWTPPELPPSDDRDVIVKLEVEDEPDDTRYMICHYENGKWIHLFRGYQINPQECPWHITAWKDIN